MTDKKDIKGIRFSKNLYGKLLRLYPTAFRKEHGVSMEQVFSDMLQEAYSETNSLFIPWLRVIREMPLSILNEHMATTDAPSPKQITLQFSLPNFRSVVSSVLVFCIQIGIFLGAVFLLYSSYNPQIPESLQVPADWELSWSFYPYIVFEFGIFLCSSAIAFWISRWERRTITILFAAEIGALLFTQLLSNVWGFACTTLVTVSHFPALGYPSCGMSSLNLHSFAFGLFAVMTLSLWILFLNNVARKTYAHRHYRVIFEKR